MVVSRLVDFGQLVEELPGWEGEVAVEVLVEHVRAQVLVSLCEATCCGD